MSTVVITGSTRGLGFGLARHFLDRGCNVVINGSSEAGVVRALSSLAACADRVHGVTADVASRSEVERLFREAEQKFSSVDIWINNAGIGQPLRKVWEIGEQEISKIAEVNILGLINGTVVPFCSMQARRSGKIFSMEGLGSDGFMTDGLAMYGASKSAITYFTKAFAREAEGSGVTIGALSPGMVVTDMLLDTIREESPESRNRMKVYEKLADDVDTVSAFLVERILAAKGSFAHIRWLTRRKALFRLLFGSFMRRGLFENT